MNTQATLKILSAGATEGPVSTLVPAFVRETGTKADVNFGTVGSLRDRFNAGEAVDVIILSSQVIAALDKDGAFVSGSITDLGRATTGVAIREGAPRPDIATPDSFKAALLAARTVGATDPAKGGSSGIYLAGLIERLGIAEAMRPKMVLGAAGRDVGHAVARGEAEMGITFTSEFIPIKGTTVAGPLPKEYEYANVYTAATPKLANVDAARAFVAFLTSPSSRAVFKACGLE
jgi:molybdate transport system substrate-binding protein